MNEFLTWEMLTGYIMFVTVVFTIVEFTKGIKIIDKIPTKYWSALIAFVLMNAVQAHAGTWASWDVVVYAINGILISLTANGLADFNKKKALK